MVSAAFLLPLLAVAAAPSDRETRLNQRVDLIEFNHFYDDLGRHAYDQVIFYEWSDEYARYNVMAWCLVENDDSRIPVKSRNGGDYVVRWFDRDAKAEREIRSRLYRETWTQFDPERADKRLLEEVPRQPHESPSAREQPQAVSR
ncbi:MAG: hypothetical protein U0892_08480 [Pirellulales bacterium]